MSGINQICGQVRPHRCHNLARYQICYISGAQTFRCEAHLIQCLRIEWEGIRRIWDLDSHEDVTASKIAEARNADA